MAMSAGSRGLWENAVERRQSRLSLRSRAARRTTPDRRRDHDRRAQSQPAGAGRNPDAGVAALCARTAVMGAFMNVKINASGYKDKDYTVATLKRGEEIEQQTIALETKIINLVNSKIQ